MYFNKYSFFFFCSLVFSFCSNVKIVTSSTRPDNVFNVIYFHQLFTKENVSGLQTKDIISSGDYKIESSITLNNNSNSINKQCLKKPVIMMILFLLLSQFNMGIQRLKIGID